MPDPDIASPYWDRREPKPRAWMYELATYRVWDNGTPIDWSGWVWRVSKDEPNAGEAMRNVTPLYARDDVQDAPESEKVAWWEEQCRQRIARIEELEHTLRQIGFIVAVARSSTGSTTP